MSDIQAGWYSDPEGGARRRYWDGQKWTEHLEPAVDAAPSEPSGSTPPTTGPADVPAAAGVATEATAASAAPPSSASSSGGNNKTLILIGAAVVGLLVLALVVKSLTGGGGGGGGDEATFCKNYRQLASIDGVEDTMRAGSLFAKLADTAPSGSVRADAQVVADGYDQIRAGNAGSVDETKITAALGRVDAYGEETCS